MPSETGGGWVPLTRVAVFKLRMILLLLSVMWITSSSVRDQVFSRVGGLSLLKGRVARKTSSSGCTSTSGYSISVAVPR